jgi:hypothetical protein
VAGTVGPRISGGCRPGTCGACHRDHPSIAGTAARRAGLDAGLAGLARDTGILSRRCRTTRRNILPKPALPASYRKNQHDRNPGGCLVLPHHTTRSPGRLGRCQAPGHPESCRICQHLPQTMPSDEWRPRRFRRDRSRRAGRGGPVPGLAAAQGPARGQGKPGSITASGRLAVTPAARAGSPLRPRRFTTTIALRPWSRSGTGRTLDGPVSMRDRVPGQARAPGPDVRSSRTRWPGGESFSCRAVSQPHGFRSPRVP